MSRSGSSRSASPAACVVAPLKSIRLEQAGPFGVPPTAPATATKEVFSQARARRALRRDRNRWSPTSATGLRMISAPAQVIERARCANRMSSPGSMPTWPMRVAAVLKSAGCPVAAVASSPKPVTRSGEILGVVSSGSPFADSRKPTVRTPSPPLTPAAPASMTRSVEAMSPSAASSVSCPGASSAGTACGSSTSGSAPGSSWRRRTSFMALSICAASASVSVALQARCEIISMLALPIDSWRLAGSSRACAFGFQHILQPPVDFPLLVQRYVEQ